VLLVVGAGGAVTVWVGVVEVGLLDSLVLLEGLVLGVVLGLVVGVVVVGLVLPGITVVFGAGTGITTELGLVLEVPVAGLVVVLGLSVAGLVGLLEPPVTALVTAVVAAFLAVSIAQAVPTGKVNASLRVSPGLSTCPPGKVMLLPLGTTKPAGKLTGFFNVSEMTVVVGSVGVSKVGSDGMVGRDGIEKPMPTRDLKLGTPLTFGIS
jgi:hypothetical protein